MIRFATADELSDRVAELEERCAILAQGDAEHRYKIAALEAKNAELRAAFEKYGDHAPGCACKKYFGARCDCGYDKARAALGGK